jgi:4'-phosphopantetheinyl transferase EntD
VAAVLEGLLDGGVISVEVDLYRDPIGELSPEEAATVPRAQRDRLLEFRAGRHCAREALGELGVHGVSILRAEDRAPLWPDGVVGSITHSRARNRGWCAAAVARSSDVQSIGIDGELDEPLERKLWPRILLPSEQAFIETRAEAEHGYLAKLIFSAKEATYKCQYPVSREFLEFADVELTLDPASDTFSARLLRDALPFRRGHTFRGRHARRQGIIATAVVLGPAPTARR